MEKARIKGCHDEKKQNNPIEAQPKLIQGQQLMGEEVDQTNPWLDPNIGAATPFSYNV